ncbi:MAG: hypothetical protein Q9160_000649 [Pyrenula sp. 1 TL-2023]
MATKRLLREAAELRRQPSPLFYAAPLPDNIFEWHFTLLGPPSPSSFASGIYHGRIVLPLTYPLRPPSFRFMTPSGRFEINTEICLSISGYHEETWQPAWGIRLALTALRSFMDESAKGQLGGLEAGEELKKRLARESRGWRCPTGPGGEGECGGGRTNEEVMRGWWEECREKGVDVEAEIEGTAKGKAEEIPKEMRIGEKKKDEGEQQQQQRQADEASTATATAQTAEAAIRDPPRNDAAVSSLDASAHSASTLPTTSESTAFSNPPPQVSPSPNPNPNPSQPIAANDPSNPSTTIQPQSQPQNLQQPTSSSKPPQPNPPPQPQTQPQNQLSPPPRAPTPTPTTPQTQPQSQFQPPAQSSTPPASPESGSTPYLDKAISGIILALILMVLKRAVAAGDFYS